MTQEQLTAIGDSLEEDDELDWSDVLAFLTLENAAALARTEDIARANTFSELEG